MTKQTNGRLRCVGAALAVALASSLAVAGADTLSPARTVPFGDLNLSSAQGAEALHRRLTMAAEQVCEPALLPGSRLVPRDYTACVARAVTEAVAKIGHSDFSARYARAEHPAW